MHECDLEVVDGAAVGTWIRPRLGGCFGAVTREVPKGYEAYARVFHPASDQEGNPLRWAEVADALGKTAHREMQWHALRGLADPGELVGPYEFETVFGRRWTGQDPPTGGMDIATLDDLCRILAAHTKGAVRCYFGLCTIENWLDSFSKAELKPLLRLPYGRDYIVLSGPLAAVGQIVRHSSDTDWIVRDAPNLIWPGGGSWFVASEVDFDSTLVGGGIELIKALVESPDLEVWEVEPADSLAADADKINVVQNRCD